MLTDTFAEDLLSNLILGCGLVALVCLRDFCKRVSHSDCNVDDNKINIKLPTWRADHTVETV